MSDLVIPRVADTIPVDGYTMVDGIAAATWLSAFNYEHQRPIRPYHVANLASEMVQGRFREKVQINFCRTGRGVYHLVNGQHTLSAIASCKLPQLLSVVVTDCADAAAVADEFARHDTHLTRQLSDALVAHEMDQALGVTRTELSWIAAACNQYSYMKGENSRHGASRLTNDQKLQLIRQYGRLGADALRVISHASAIRNAYICRRTTLACVMHVYQWSPDACSRFYGDMALDDGLKTGDPRKTLLEYFRDRVTAGGAWTTVAVRKVTPDHYFVKAQAVAFNAFIADKTLKLIRFDKDVSEAKFVGPGTVRA